MVAKYETCAQALPGAPPVQRADGQRLYRVAPFCRSASPYRDVFNREIASVLIMGPDVCQDCPMYTDRARVISIRSRGFQAELFLDRLADLPVSKLRRLFALTLAEVQENWKAICAVDAYLAERAAGQSGRWAKVQALWSDTKHKMNIK